MTKLKHWYRVLTPKGWATAGFLAGVVVLITLKLAYGEVCTNFGGGIIICSDGTKLVSTGGGTAIITKDDDK